MPYCKRIDGTESFERLGIRDQRAIRFLWDIQCPPEKLIKMVRYCVWRVEEKDDVCYPECVESDTVVEKFCQEDLNFYNPGFVFEEAEYCLKIAVPAIMHAGYIRQDAEAYLVCWRDDYGLLELFGEIDWFDTKTYELAAPLSVEKIWEISDLLIEEGFPFIYAEMLHYLMVSSPIVPDIYDWHHSENKFSGIMSPSGDAHPFIRQLARRTERLIRKLDDDTKKKVREVLISQ